MPGDLTRQRRGAPPPPGYRPQIPGSNGATTVRSGSMGPTIPAVGGPPPGGTPPTPPAGSPPTGPITPPGPAGPRFGPPRVRPPGTPVAPPTTPAPTPLLHPSVPGATVTPFGPTQGDLQGGFIAPTQSARGATASGRTDAAAGTAAAFSLPTAVGSYATNFTNRLAPTDVEFDTLDTDLEAGDRVDPTDSAALQQFRTMRGDAATNLTNGRTRSQIAQDQMEAFDLENQPQLRDQLRAVGQRAASLGRLGMGDTAVEALNPFTDYLTRRAGMAKQLGAETAEGEISDRFNTLDASRGLVGEEEGIGAGRRNELRGERDYETDIDDTNVQRRIGERNTALDVRTGNTNRRFDANRAALELATGVSGTEQAGNLARVNTMAGLEGDITDRESDQRGELRDERDFQTMTGRQAIEDFLRERDYLDYRGDGEGNEGDLAYQRRMADSAIEAGLSPGDIFMQGAGIYGGGAAGATAGASNLLGQWLARNRQPTSGGGN